MLAAIKHVVDNSLVFQQHSTVFAMYSEALVSWGGKINHHLIAYSLSSTLPASAQCISIGFTRRSLDAKSAASLVHAFVMSRVGYCNTLLAGTSKSTTDKLQWVLNTAARVIIDTRKYDHRLSHLLHDQPYWLDVPQWVQFKLCAMVHRCLQQKASCYMIDCCTPTSDVACRQHLQSAGCHN